MFRAGIILLFVISLLQEYPAIGASPKMLWKKVANAVREKCNESFCGTSEDTAPETWDFTTESGCRVAAYTIKNTRKDRVTRRDKPLEDRYSVHKGYGMVGFAVYDGHGGVEVAEYAKERLIPCMLRRLHEKREADPVELINGVIHRFDKHIVKKQLSSGTTATIGIVDGETLYTANLGDSRTVFKRNGTLWQTTDHKPSEGSEKERIESSGGLVGAGGVVWLTGSSGYPRMELGSVAVSRSLGDAEFKPAVSADADITVIKWRKEKVGYLILGSDGLWDKVENEYAVRKASEWILTKSLGVRELAYKAREKGSSDDITVMVVKLT